MADANRRRFLGSAAAGSASALTAFHWSNLARGSSFLQRPVLGLIGCGGRSKSLAAGFAGNANFAWVCDPDQSRSNQLQEQTGARNTTSDLRRVLDDDNVDAVVIATPDHWHAPAAILACEAGKHVYVEKPCSHNFRESQLLVAAARRHGVTIQHGTQSRSSRMIAGAIQLLRDGVIGDVLFAKAWNIQRRRNIGRAKPGAPPPNVDYDTWVGPAEMMPFQSNRFHYDWHWWHNFGTGDIGNDGTHELDIARWGLAVTGVPSTVSAVGGKYYFDDDQEFPDTATCIFEWPGNDAAMQRRQLVFEMRIWSRSMPYNCDTGIEFHGTRGMLFVSKRGKLEIRDDANHLMPAPEPAKQISVAANHQVDFLESFASGTTPSADIQTAHESVALVHLANASLRAGATLSIDPESESIKGNPKAARLLGRSYRQEGHWGAPQLT